MNVDFVSKFGCLIFLAVLCGCGPQPVQDVLSDSWTPAPRPAPEIPAISGNSGLERLTSRDLERDQPLLEVEEKRHRILLGKQGEFVSEVVTGFGRRGRLTKEQMLGISAALNRADVGKLPAELCTRSDVYCSLKTFGADGRLIRVLPRDNRDSKELSQLEPLRQQIRQAVPSPASKISGPVQARWSKRDSSGTAQAMADIRLRKNHEFQQLNHLSLPAPSGERVDSDSLFALAPTATDRMLVYNGGLSKGQTKPMDWIVKAIQGLEVGKEMSLQRSLLASRGQYWLNQTDSNHGCTLVSFDGDAEPSAARFFHSLDEHGIAFVGTNRIRFGWEASNGAMTGPNVCTSYFYTSPRPGFYVLAYDLESLTEVLEKAAGQRKEVPPRLRALLPLAKSDAPLWGFHEVQDGEQTHPFPMPAGLHRLAISYRPGQPLVLRSPDSPGDVPPRQFPPDLDFLFSSGFFLFI